MKCSPFAVWERVEVADPLGCEEHGDRSAIVDTVPRSDRGEGRTFCYVPRIVTDSTEEPSSEAVERRIIVQRMMSSRGIA